MTDIKNDESGVFSMFWDEESRVNCHEVSHFDDDKTVVTAPPFALSEDEISWRKWLAIAVVLISAAILGLWVI